MNPALYQLSYSALTVDGTLYARAVDLQAISTIAPAVLAAGGKI
jgi:hypothetical protein